MLQFVLGIKNRRRRIVSIDVVRLARAHAHTHARSMARAQGRDVSKSSIEGLNIMLSAMYCSA